MLREVTSNDFFIILLTTCLVFLAVAKFYFPKRFSDFIYIIGNFKYLKIYSREQKFFDTFDALLFLNFIINAAVFIYLAYNGFFGGLSISINLMFKLVFGIGAFFLIKVLLERLIGSLFEIDELIDKYLFQKISYKNFLGLLLIPVNILLIFSLNPTPKVLYIILFLLLTINVFGLIASTKNYQNYIKYNLFYFILYLCALEIAPYLILYKVFEVN